MFHLTHPHLATERFGVTLVGAGGNGSQMLTCLARLHHAITALGHPGFDVVTFDPDTVSAANVGRQMFSPADVGQPKAHVLTTRVNAFFGLQWESVAERYAGTGAGLNRLLGHRREILIVCVDSAKSRAGVRAAAAQRAPVYILDLGNRASDGQMILGQLPEWTRAKDQPKVPGHTPLPDPYTLLPELVDRDAKDDDTPSCSLAEALERQELFVNDDVTRVAALLLWNLLRRGRIEWHGAFVNAATGKRTVVPVDPEVWARMQCTGPAVKRRRGKGPNAQGQRAAEPAAAPHGSALMEGKT